MAGEGGGALVLKGLTKNEVMNLLKQFSGRLDGMAQPVSSAAGAGVREAPSRTQPRIRKTRGSGAPQRYATVTNAQIEAATDLDALGQLVAMCERCPLHATRKHGVPGEGPMDARVVCVGEAPGAEEDRTGRPFVGRAGKLLDRFLASVGLARESVYICNVLKSRPPGNRDPDPAEIAECVPFLHRQLELIKPKVIVAFGLFAARTLLNSRESLSRLRSSEHEYAGYPLVATYHPAGVLRNPAWTRLCWEDLQRVRRILDE